MIAAFLCGVFYGTLWREYRRKMRLRRSLERELVGMEEDAARELALFYAWLEDDGDQRFWEQGGGDSSAGDDANWAYYGPWNTNKTVSVN